MIDLKEKKEYKKKVLAWLAENNIFPDKVRVYNTRRYGLEVRVYTSSQTFPNTKKSRRKMETDAYGNNCTYGIHSRTYAMYTAINDEAMATPEEREFTLACLRA